MRIDFKAKVCRYSPRSGQCDCSLTLTCRGCVRTRPLLSSARFSIADTVAKDNRQRVETHLAEYCGLVFFGACKHAHYPSAADLQRVRVNVIARLSSGN